MLASDELGMRLISRFRQMFGAQKVDAVFGDQDMADVVSLWGKACLRFENPTLGRAMDDLLASGRQWPPTLPEWVEMCRQASLGRSVSGHRQVLPAPGNGETDRETARANLERIKQMLAGAVKRMPA